MPPPGVDTNSHLGPEPPVMTWGRAAPVLAVCLLFDLVQLFFEFFWVTGPAAAGTAVGAWFATYIGDFLGSLVGGAVAIGSGFTVGFALAGFGIVMADIIIGLGYGVVGTWFTVSNRRIFKANAWQLVRFVGSLALEVVPILDSLPAMTFFVWRMYHHQIKKERAAHAAWLAEHQAQEDRQRAELATHIAYRRAAANQTALAANDNAHVASAGEEGAANDNTIPAYRRPAA